MHNLICRCFLPSQVDAIYKSKVDQLNGIGVTIVLGQTHMYTGYGSRDASDPTAGTPTADGIFRLASVSKVFTSLLAFKMDEEGTVDLDDPVSKHLPGYVDPPAGGWSSHEAITLRALAANAGGIQKNVPYPCSIYTIDGYPGFPDPDNTVPAACKSEAGVLNLTNIPGRNPAVWPPLQRFHYSNQGFACLARALGHADVRAKGTSWSELAFENAVIEEILAPLGMTSTGFEYGETNEQGQPMASRMQVGFYGPASQNAPPAPYGMGPTGTNFSKSVGFQAGGGGIYGSHADLARFIKLYFRSAAAKGATADQIVDGATLTALLKPLTLSQDVAGGAVGYPFEMVWANGTQAWLRGKSGQLEGYRNELMLDPRLQLGMFVNGLASHATDVPMWTVEAIEILSPPIKAALARLQPAPDTAQRARAAQYVGTYSNNGTLSGVFATPTTISVTWDAATNELSMTKVSGDFTDVKLTAVDWPSASWAAVPPAGAGLAHTMRAFDKAQPHQYSDCDLLNDSENWELASFEVPSEGAKATSVIFNSEWYGRV